MNEQIEHARNVVAAAASSPKVATAVATGAGAAGAAQKMEIITGWMGTASVALGMLTAGVVLGIQIIKFAREWREFQGVKRRGKR